MTTLPPAPNSTLQQVSAVDSAGNLFIADAGNNVIRRVDPAGTIFTFAGNYSLGPGCGGDGGAAAGARLYAPSGIALDEYGNLFIADSANNVIRKVAPMVYWDPNQTGTEDTGGSGTWTSAGGVKCWYDPLLARTLPGARAATRFFAGTGGTVAMSGAVSPTSVTFGCDNYVVTAATANDSLTLPSAGVSVSVTADQAEIDAPIAGCGTLIVNGPGAWDWAVPTSTAAALTWRAERCNCTMKRPWAAAAWPSTVASWTSTATASRSLRWAAAGA